MWMYACLLSHLLSVFSFCLTNHKVHTEERYRARKSERAWKTRTQNIFICDSVPFISILAFQTLSFQFNSIDNSYFLIQTHVFFPSILSLSSFHDAIIELYFVVVVRSFNHCWYHVVTDTEDCLACCTLFQAQKHAQRKTTTYTFTLLYSCSLSLSLICWMNTNMGCKMLATNHQLQHIHRSYTHSYSHIIAIARRYHYQLQFVLFALRPRYCCCCWIYY